MLSFIGIASSGLRGATAIDVSIDGTLPIAKTSTHLVSANFDWHKNSEEYPAWSGNVSAMTVDLESHGLRAAAKALAPGILRIGGSEGDLIVYDVDGTGASCKGDPKHYAQDPAFCLTMVRWAALVTFAQETGMQLVFGLNAMTYRNCTLLAPCAKPLNLTNIEEFLSHTAQSGLRVYGFEMGNEKPNIDPKTMANDVVRVARLLRKYWPDGSTIHRPLLIGTDLNPDASYLRTFLPLVSGALDVLTYHNYVAEGGQIPQAEFMTPEYLDKGPQQSADVLAAHRELAPNIPIWVGEIAACWHSGQRGWTDRFGDAFWYVDALAARAALNHTGFLRQTLVGGYYGLLDRATFTPTADLYAALLFKRLMGIHVLMAQVGSTDSDAGLLRAWAHCTPKSPTQAGAGGSVSVVLINLSGERRWSVKLKLSGHSHGTGRSRQPMAPRTWTRTEFELTSATGELTGSETALNGERLQPSPLHDLPPLEGRPLAPDEPLVVEPHSIKFVVLDGAAAQACM
jgi:heparanase 1